MPVRPAVVPVLRYADAPAAIAFLRDGFGFAVHAVHADPADPAMIHHAELVRGGCLLMLSSARPTAFARAMPMRTAAEAGCVTQSVHVVIDDVDGHAAIAAAHGADIVLPPADQPQGGRGYAARDPEGNAWSFGSYDPFAPRAPGQ